jgi:predicted ATPase
MSGLLDRQLVAVMFTDVAGYTALMQAEEHAALEKRDRYMRALEVHHEACGGTIVQRLGDGSMSMFPSSLAAVTAAVRMQRDLAAHEVPVRIGIHVGEVIVEPERLSGDAVNIAARIESFAVPGGVMLSEAAYEQIRNRSDVEVLPLGRFKLKNVGRPFELYAVAADGVVVPAPQGLEGKGEHFSTVPSNLPAPGAPLIGRADDLESLAELVREYRVVTITGPGGVGKTRIAIELGRSLASEFLDGVSLIRLADVTDPADVLAALANELDVKEAEGRTLGEGIVSLIGDKTALLLLDNLEQVVAAAPDIAGLVERCPSLRIVTTSRTPLRIAAEREYPLSPLGLAAATALVVDRAASIELTNENADALAAICRRLDGLPLALELAAARLRLLSPEALLERLDRALDVLTSGTRDAAERQQTLRATIDWSHSLLEEPEQRLFRHMAVFAGSCTLSDLEAVCAGDGESVLDHVESLVDKALVQADGQSGRLRMLQTIGDFAREQLDESGERAEMAERHARHYGEVAREIRDGIEGSAQVASVERGIAEEGNLHAALDTLLARAQSGEHASAEAGMQMSGDLWMYWHVRGKNVSAREYAEAFLAAGGGRAPSAGRAAALLTVALGSWMTGQVERATDEWGEAYRVAEKVGAERELCLAAVCTGTLGLLGVDAKALEWEARGIERSRAAGFDWALGLGLTFDGMLYAAQGDAETARARFSEALEIQERLGDREGGGVSLGGLAQLAAADGKPGEALELYRQALAAFEEVGDRGEEARILSEMAWTYLQNGDSAPARHHFFEAVQAHTDIASVRGVGLALVGLAAVEAVEHRPERAVQIAAAAEVYAQQEGIVVVYSDETPGRELVEGARGGLPPDDLARATELGRRLTIEQALELVKG